MLASSISRRYYNFFVSILVVLLFGFGTLCIFQIFTLTIGSTSQDAKAMLFNEQQWSQVTLNGYNQQTPTKDECSYFDCFNVYRCGRSMHQKLSIYVYPPVTYVDEDNVQVQSISEEFTQILETIIDSKYFTSDPSEACILVPPIDLLNENSLRRDKIAEALSSLKHWNNGENHLLFNMLAGTSPDFKTALTVNRGSALLAGGGFSSFTYRRGFDIAIPIYNPIYQHSAVTNTQFAKRKWLMTSSQINIHRNFREDLQAQLTGNEGKLLILNRCADDKNATKRCRHHKIFEYPQILHDSKLCLVIRGGRLGQAVLYDTMKAGCIPVVVADSFILPFSEVVDWRTISIQIYEEQFLDLVNIITQHYSADRLEEMHKQVVFIFNEYFNTIKHITLTTLEILNDRVFPAHAKSTFQWNYRPRESAVLNPLFLPITAPADDGFTAVVLTHDRIQSLFQVIENISKVASVMKILVVWNNQRKRPPAVTAWPKISVPLKIIETDANRLSNRFLPFEEIETECILAIDDDINMMTKDELQFGYEVWREFPDRIVGFPSRNVVWNNVSGSWFYDSEWTNEVSMVLTGVAFYHKYWSYAYSNEMPGNIKQWVDDNMNCEDIAMNFLVANHTGKAPIKVTPRKKFKCGQCTSGDLSANQAHLVERSQCVEYFSKVFGTMPLKTIEFRADPVLFKDKLPIQMKKYNDVGSL